MLTSASGRCSFGSVPSARACRGRTSSCRAGSCRARSARDISPTPADPPSPADPCAARRRRRRRWCRVSSLFQSAKRIDRSVCTSGLLNTRASSITSAVPDPSSLAASPQPMPSMWPPTRYISSGWWCRLSCSRRPGAGPAPPASVRVFNSRSFGSGCASALLFTGRRARLPRIRLPPALARDPPGRGRLRRRARRRPRPRRARLPPAPRRAGRCAACRCR